MARDVVGARRYMAPDCVMVFTGARSMEGPEGPRTFDARRYALAKKRVFRTEVWNDSAEILLARAGLAEAPL